MSRQSSRGRNGPVIVRVSEEAEDAVRRYLELLEHPDERRDAKNTVDVAAIRASVDDPLEAVRLVNKALSDAAEVEDPEAAFIRYAKTWSQHNGVSREAFEMCGVKRKVLDQAFGPAKPPAQQVKRPRISVDAIVAGITAKRPGATFTGSEVAAELGGSVETIRKALERLAREGLLIKLGPDPRHAGPGRAPTIYERA